VLLVILQLGDAGAANIQKWVDSEGKVHYGERPPQAQESEAVSAKVSTVTPLSSGPSLVLYSTAWCGYCKKARAFMRQEGIRFREYDIEKTPSAKRRYDKMGGKGVPLLVRGGETLQGFSVQRYRQFFQPKN